MYEYSRAVFRDIAPHIAPGAPRAEILRACESTVERLALDPDFLRPARTLFNEIRGYFPLGAQTVVWAVVEREIDAAVALLDADPDARFAITGAPDHCSATNRRGGSCSRTPKAGSRYCPSHQHLAGDGDDDALAA